MTVVTDELVQLAAVLAGEEEERVKAILVAALPLLLKQLVPSMEEIATAIDNNYDEEQYSPVFSADGVCVESNAARAVLSLMLPKDFRFPEVKGNEQIKQVYRLVWEDAYAQGVEDERISQELTEGMHPPGRSSPYA